MIDIYFVFKIKRELTYSTRKKKRKMETQMEIKHLVGQIQPQIRRSNSTIRWLLDFARLARGHDQAQNSLCPTHALCLRVHSAGSSRVRLHCARCCIRRQLICITKCCRRFSLAYLSWHVSLPDNQSNDTSLR